MQQSNIAWTDDPEAVRRFEAKVDQDTDSGCWEWTAAKNPRGYGRFRLDGRTRHAHRLAYEMVHGEIPEGLQINHHCDNPSCVRADHLYAGTQRENIKDALDHGAFIEGRARGEDNANTVLNEEQVSEIRRLYEKTGHTQRSLAEDFGVSKGAIQDILERKTWAHVGGPEVDDAG